MKNVLSRLEHLEADAAAIVARNVSRADFNTFIEKAADAEIIAAARDTALIAGRDAGDLRRLMLWDGDDEPAPDAVLKLRGDVARYCQEALTVHDDFSVVWTRHLSDPDGRPMFNPLLIPNNGSTPHSFLLILVSGYPRKVEGATA